MKYFGGTPGWQAFRGDGDGDWVGKGSFDDRGRDAVWEIGQEKQFLYSVPGGRISLDIARTYERRDKISEERHSSNAKILAKGEIV